MKRLYAFCFLLRQLGVDPYGAVIGEDDHAGVWHLPVFDVFDRNVIDRHVFRAARLAVIGGDGGCLKDGCFVRLDAAALHDDVGTGEYPWYAAIDLYCLQS